MLSAVHPAPPLLARASPANQASLNPRPRPQPAYPRRPQRRPPVVRSVQTAPSAMVPHVHRALLCARPAQGQQAQIVLSVVPAGSVSKARLEAHRCSACKQTRAACARSPTPRLGRRRRTRLPRASSQTTARSCALRARRRVARVASRTSVSQARSIRCSAPHASLGLRSRARASVCRRVLRGRCKVVGSVSVSF